MSKKQIHTNLVGKRVRLTEEISQGARWHSKSCLLWRFADPEDMTTGEFVGDYANTPGGKDATAEVVAVHLNSDGGLVAAIKWEADGTIRVDMPIECFVVISEDGE